MSVVPVQLSLVSLDALCYSCSFGGHYGAHKTRNIVIILCNKNWGAIRLFPKKVLLPTGTIRAYILEQVYSITDGSMLKRVYGSSRVQQSSFLLLVVMHS